MSSLIVEVCQIDEVLPHTNSEVHSLEICHIKGWQCITKKGQFTLGEKVVFIPPDTVLPTEVSDRLGVTNYLSGQRVKSIKLKGEPSYGIIIKPDNEAWKIGDNVADYYGATKYVPPPPSFTGTGKTGRHIGSLPDHPYFWKYTDIENMRHYPRMISEGEEVVMTEKLHGTNSRLGYVRDAEGDDPILCVGSKNLRRKMPTKVVKVPPATGYFAWVRNACRWLLNGCSTPTMEIPDLVTMKSDWFWFPYTQPGVPNLLLELIQSAKNQVQIFGEVYGTGVQTLTYGQSEGLAYRAFDILVDGNYLDYDDFLSLCEKHEVPTVPLVYRGPFSLAKAKELSEGQTCVCETKQIREGIVAKPVKERRDPRLGRVILKYVGDEYLQAKEPDKKGKVVVSDFSDE